MNMLISIALSQYGLKEVKGSKDHPQIINYFTSLGFDTCKLKEETSWCSVFISWVAHQAGYEKSNYLTARSWLSVDRVDLDCNQPCVTITDLNIIPQVLIRKSRHLSIREAPPPAADTVLTG